MDLRSSIQYNRRISNAFTRVLAKTPLRPNHITTLSLVCGMAAGFFFSQGSRLDMLAGALWIHISFILDNCDGEIARMKSQSSSLGAWYDLISDLCVDFCIWVGLAIACLGSITLGWIIAFLNLAILGSIANFLLVIVERKKNCHDSYHVDSTVKESRKHSSFHSILEFLSRNGDSAIFVWIMALIGNPWIFLIGGACYINGLWLTRLASNWKQVMPILIMALYVLMGSPLACHAGVELMDENHDGIKETQIYTQDGEVVKKISDFNNDGQADRIIQYKNGLRNFEEKDVNLDGAMDYWVHYNEKGRRQRLRKDSNADGNPDSWRYFIHGNVEALQEQDKNFDGIVDYRALKRKGFDKRRKTHRLMIVWMEQDKNYDGVIDIYRERGIRNPKTNKVGQEMNGAPTEYIPKARPSKGSAKRVTQADLISDRENLIFQSQEGL